MKLASSVLLVGRVSRWGQREAGKFSSRSLINANMQSLPTRCCSSLVSAVPANLTLADGNILQPKKLPVIKAQDYIFPLLEKDVPKTIPVKIFSKPGEFAEPAPLDAKIFGVAIRKDIVHDVIRHHRAKLRQPKRTKRMSEISGSNKKPRPQKGTGSAQVGHKRNSVWRGGQKAHGPVLRSYAFDINKKVRAQAMMIALAAKHREGNLIVFDNLNVESPKTKEVFKLLEAHNLSEHGCIIVDNYFSDAFLMATGNIKRTRTMKMIAVHTYEIVRREKLVITREALESLQARLKSQSTHECNRRSLLRRMNLYEQISRMGAQLTDGERGEGEDAERVQTQEANQ